MTDIEIKIQNSKVNSQTEHILDELKRANFITSWKIKGLALIVSRNEK